MARKPNFRFERQERERIQAEKRAARDALKEQRKGESEGATAAPGDLAVEDTAAPDAPASSPAAAAPSPPLGPSAAPAPPVPPAPAHPTPANPTAAAPEAPKEAVIAAMKALETMTPEQIATMHQNAVRLASSGSPKQRAAAQELLPRLEAELQRLDAAKRAGAAKRPKKQ
jgi:hypothetical protein